RGILLVNEDIEKKSDGFIIRLVKDNIALKFKIGDLFTVKSADEYSKKVINASDISTLKKAMLLRVIQKSIEQNIFYDEQKSKDAKKELLSDISLTRGMVQKGEKIIAKGEVVTQQSYRNLKSLEKDFSMRLGENYSSKFIYLGHGILIVVMMMIFFIYIFFFRKDVYEENKKIVLILFVILMIVMLTSFTSQYNPDFLYIVPIAILPILIRAFFDARLAIYVHLIAVMIFGFIVPDSFNFVVMQIVAGIVAVVSIFNLHRRAQFFITSFFIMISYFVVYTGLHLLGQGSFENYQYTDLVLLAGSAVLSLFAYPLIYIFEKVFGIVTDVTLLELSDTNGKLLRRLAVVAPGTFHHSNQVAILAEEAIREIGGNALLVRAGALYHDIGKMDTPIFFTENQSNGINPHDDLSNEESSRIIRSHVIKGVELAKKNNLPEQLIDFIRTHHGTRKTEYFYVRQKLDNPDEGLSEKNYTYHGPIPFSKETAVLMIADSVEAASKSMTAPDEQKISALVESVVAKLFESNQLMNADITLRDIRAVKKILKRQLMNIYHLRIEYPD
ncbi:MAG: HDIG domain-containing protein, partial [Bacteroidota bacterium]|nr:HDIG domain-containing protein [Bacteroidota bacterium]